ncbi:sugar transferase [Flavobacteriaceae bacterium]|nr:sugar transferase [Flavobacteriaceae bacterium]MDB2599166.1 sugar transferase [Flavobacteriaceae bacterium]
MAETKYSILLKKKIKKKPLKKSLNGVLKRTFDIAFSGLILVFFLSWMFPLFALIIKLQSSGAVIYKQLREGKDGVHFLCFKFRTMHLNGESDSSWTKLNDPRVTKFGVFLRRTSLDEFPQFLNVFLGQMSVVGPRPHPIKLNDTYRDSIQKFSLRHETRPGVTGLSQMKGYRGSITHYHQMNSRVKLDRFYIRSWTFLLDLKIILLTIPATIHWGLSRK